MEFEIEKHIIFLTVHGSRAYGTNLPTSDYDFKGIAIPPKKYFFGFSTRFEQSEQMVANGHPHDRVIYDIRKFMGLAADANPNIIEVLFANPSDYQVVSPEGLTLLDNRDLFISKKVRYTFSGYALAQLKRINTHRSWLLNPPTGRPDRKDFGLPDKAVNESQLGAAYALIEKGHTLADDVMVRLSNEKRYGAAVQHWKQYEDWKKNRNPDRAAMEAKFGFDGKHGLHLIRLMRMAVEILEGKGVLVRRPDAEELLDIRRGSWDYDRLTAEATRLSELAEKAYETSTLPNSAPINKLNDLCATLVEDYLSRNR